MKRRLKLLWLLAGLCGGFACGVEPTPPPMAPTTLEEATANAAPLTSGQVWTGTLGDWGASHGFSYQSGGRTWYPRAPITQLFQLHAVYYTDLLGDGFNARFMLDASKNEITLTCAGSNTLMANNATYLANVYVLHCTTYSHIAGEGSWHIGSSVSIPVANLVYLGKGSDGTVNGYFWVNIAVPRFLDGDGYGLSGYTGGSLPILIY